MPNREIVKELVKKYGHPVLVGSPYCVKRREKYAKCSGCESELGCLKMIGLELAVVTSELLLEKMEYNILAAQTTEEVKISNSIVKMWTQAVRNFKNL